MKTHGIVRVAKPFRKRPLARLVWGILIIQLLLILMIANSTQNPAQQKLPQPERTIRQLAPNDPSAASCPRHYMTLDPGVLECPSSRGIVLLPANYPPRTIFVGYTSEPDYFAFLKTLIERNRQRKPPLQIVVLIPRLEAEQAYYDLKPFMKPLGSNHLTFFPTPSDETLWTQDYMEVGISMLDGEAKVIDLPYTDREGESIPASIALACQLDLLSQADYEITDETPQSGDYGGNIEAFPGNLLLVGNTITKATRQRLQAILTEMSIIEIKVDWLETGHVDELFAVLPNLTSNSATCPFAVAYTSPKLALQLVKRNGIQPNQDRLEPETASLQDVSAELQDTEFFSDCLSAYAQSKRLSKRCQRFIDANTYYDALVEQERNRLDTMLRGRNVCADITWVALPQLFVPSFSVWLQGSQWGTQEDRAQALNPNAVNVISLGEDLIIPQQPYVPFAQEIARRLRPLGSSLLPIDATFSHFLNGGLHCNTAVVRTCRKKSQNALQKN